MAHTLDDGVLCAECWSKFNWISDPKCYICGYPFPADLDLGRKPLCPTCAAGKIVVDRMRAACVYDDASRGVMLPFKHAGILKYKKLMGRAMLNTLCDFDDCVIDMVLPVPLSYQRLWKRGYNQAALLARPVARHLNIPIDFNSVRRKHRADMGHKNASARRKNINGVFSVACSENIKGKSILLVDDVMTTGATLAELRRVLKRAGAKAVYSVVFCRVVKAI
ncbi:MAG: ComF family protein [Alphaproteobacteria bacterium]|nr:ComF family protein [Alphaproteobacteria bacterium]